MDFGIETRQQFGHGIALSMLPLYSCPQFGHLKFHFFVRLHSLQRDWRPSERVRSG